MSNVINPVELKGDTKLDIQKEVIAKYLAEQNINPPSIESES